MTTEVVSAWHSVVGHRGQYAGHAGVGLDGRHPVLAPRGADLASLDRVADDIRDASLFGRGLDLLPFGGVAAQHGDGIASMTSSPDPANL